MYDVLAFQVRIVGENLFNGSVGTNLPQDHGNSHAHTADARPAPHDERVARDAVKVSHEQRSGGIFKEEPGAAFCCSPEALAEATDEDDRSDHQYYDGAYEDGKIRDVIEEVDHAAFRWIATYPEPILDRATSSISVDQAAPNEFPHI